MAFEPEFLDLLPHTITIEAATGRDKFNALTYGTPQSYRCHITDKQDMVSNIQGFQVVANTHIWCAPNDDGVPTGLTPECRVTMPDGSHPALLRVEVQNDNEGAHHFVIWCDRPFRE